MSSPPEGWVVVATGDEFYPGMKLSGVLRPRTDGPFAGLVKPELAPFVGRRIGFSAGWVIEGDTRPLYDGDWACIPNGDENIWQAGGWVAFGDLAEVWRRV